jgi:hypothetical protein
MAAGGVAALMALGGLRAQDPAQLAVSDPNCIFFGPDHDTFAGVGKLAAQARLTQEVSARMTMASSAVRPEASLSVASLLPGRRLGEPVPSGNNIDKYIFQALSQAAVAPAPPTTDWEFVRRVYLDLNGRIPTPAQTLAFVNDTTPKKREALVDSLVGSPDWVNKWTVWFGDFFQNNSSNTQITRFVPGAMGFNTYIRNALMTNKPYNQIAREIITATGSNSYTQGELNFLVGGVVTGGPQQDIFDQQIANTAATFLGLSNLNCLLCHDGRGHLDQINLWGYYTSRQQAWGMASFMSRTDEPRTDVTPGVASPYYWGLEDNVKYKKDYQINTQTGNRPPRGPTNSTLTVAPRFVLGGQTVTSGTNYRAALANDITSNFLFAQAAVNYMWAYFFTAGIVDPPNQFDPLRLDPNNPPTPDICPVGAPCTLQPSNPALLNALANDFIASGYDLQALMKEIVNSRTYQLSSRYEGTWNPANANLFGRKMVRRLWSEEVHDAIAQSSAQVPTYNNATWGPANWAMQFPEPLNTPDGGNGAVNNFLNAFLRGNRDDQVRKPDGSISQALNLMNDNFVMSRIKPATAGLLKTSLAITDNTQMVNNLFLNVLSRYPTPAELSAALANLQSNRTQEAQNLLWSLYNKVDFVFNY